MKLTKKQMTQACQRYARKYGYYVRTVRDVTALKIAAITEYKKSHLVIGYCVTGPQKDKSGKITPIYSSVSVEQ